MNDKPKSDEIELDVMLRAFALFCASICVPAGGSSSSTVLSEAKRYEDYIRNGK